MSNFTYEYENTSRTLETFEWDSTWHEHTEDLTTPRVLYLGDSISHATRKALNELSEGRLLFDGLATSKAIDHPCYDETVLLFAKQQPHREHILLNSGLHGFHLSDEDEYAAHYEEKIQFLLAKFPEAKLTLLLTTCVSDTARDLRVKARNAAVLRLAEQYALPAIDLYSLSRAHAELLSEDGVHWQPEGYRHLARAIFQAL
ncbi:MAG: SGNH/GDSL hydrolase family protein [Clostridia bacterium]|nr:SGNH/GDSL hydrolase family protein [Clostridia bacterium]